MKANKKLFILNTVPVESLTSLGPIYFKAIMAHTKKASSVAEHKTIYLVKGKIEIISRAYSEDEKEYAKKMTYGYIYIGPSKSKSGLVSFQEANVWVSKKGLEKHIGVFEIEEFKNIQLNFEIEEHIISTVKNVYEIETPIVKLIEKEIPDPIEICYNTKSKKKLTVKDWHQNNPGYEYLKPGFKVKLIGDDNVEIEILRTTVSMTHAFGFDDKEKAFVTNVPGGQFRMQVKFFVDGKEINGKDIGNYDLNSDRFFLDKEKHLISMFDTFSLYDNNGRQITQGEIELDHNSANLPK